MAILPTVEQAAIEQLKAEMGDDLNEWIKLQLQAIASNDGTLGEFLVSQWEDIADLLERHTGGSPDELTLQLVMMLGCEMYRVLEIQFLRDIQSN